MSLSPRPTRTYRVLRNRNGRSGPGSLGRLSQEQSWAAPSPHRDILDARDPSEHSWEFAFSIRGILAQLCFSCSQEAMPRLWTRMRSRKREEGWDKEGQVVPSNTALMHSPRSGFSVAPPVNVSQRVLTEFVGISDGFSPWKASFSSGLFLEKQICIVLSECRCIHLLLALPSKLAVSFCCQTVLLWAPSVLCVHSVACEKRFVYLASGTRHCKIPSQNVPLFKPAWDSGWLLWQREWGTAGAMVTEEKQVVPSCAVQSLQPRPFLLSLDVPELQMDLMLQINLNCK